MALTYADVAKEFRIITDGQRFRIQRLTETGWWLWRSKQWVTESYVSPECKLFPVEHASLEDAECSIRMKINKILSEQRNWTVVVPRPEPKPTR